MNKKLVEFVALSYIVIWTISPPLQISMIYRLAALGCAGVLFLCNKFDMKKEHIYATIFMILIAATEYYISGNFLSALSQIGTYMLFFCYLMNYWYENNWNKFKFIIPIVLILLAVWNYRSSAVLESDAAIARLIVRNDELANGYLLQGVGGYGLMYSQVIIAPAIFSWILNALKKSKLNFVCGCIWTITFIQFLNSAGYTIAVVATVIGVVVLLLYRRKSIIPALIISGLLLILLVYLIGFNETVRNYLLTVFDGTKIARKIMDITSTVTTDETADSISFRMNRYGVSVQSIFLKYPIIGGWWNGGAGGHSTLLDAFGKYGIFGGIIMFRMLYCVPFIWKNKKCSPVVLRTVNATIISISFVVILDSVPYNLVMMLMVIFPIILSDIERWNSNDEYIMDSKSNTNRVGG